MFLCSFFSVGFGQDFFGLRMDLFRLFQYFLFEYKNNVYLWLLFCSKLYCQMFWLKLRLKCSFHLCVNSCRHQFTSFFFVVAKVPTLFSAKTIYKMRPEKFCCCAYLIDGSAYWGVISTVLCLFDCYNFEKIQQMWSSMVSSGNRGPTYPSNMAAINIYYIFVVISSVLLTCGAVKINHWLMLPWLIISAIPLVIFALLVVVFLFINPAAILILGSVLSYYIWWCVRSAFEKLRHFQPWSQMHQLSCQRDVGKRCQQIPIRQMKEVPRPLRPVNFMPAVLCAAYGQGQRSKHIISATYLPIQSVLAMTVLFSYFLLSLKKWKFIKSREIGINAS